MAQDAIRSNLTNTTNLSMIMAAWLASDGYDHEPENLPTDGIVFSATQLLKPTRMIVLSSRMDVQEFEEDVTDRAASRIGQAVHDSIEKSLTRIHQKRDLLTSMGFPEKVIERIVVNPTKKQLEGLSEAVPLYMELRGFRQLVVPGLDFKIYISGKFDQLFGNEISDNKVTSAYKYEKVVKENGGEWVDQMSIYRWIHNDKGISDIAKVNFIISDWKRSEAARNSNYPAKPVMEYPIHLKSLRETEQMLIAKIKELVANDPLDEPDIKFCTDEELWRTPPVYKYYAKQETADKGGRASKNFDSYTAASNYKATKGKGVVKTFPGEVRRCLYCSAAPNCSQRIALMS